MLTLSFILYLPGMVQNILNITSHGLKVQKKYEK